MTPTILDQEIRNQWFFFLIQLICGKKMGPKSPHQRIASNQPGVSFFFSFVVSKVWQICSIREEAIVFEFIYSKKKNEIFQKQNSPSPTTPQNRLQQVPQLLEES
jgi:hypothetical protein